MLLYLKSVNSIREYFIGDYLRQSPDVLKQASIRLIYNIISVALFSLVIFFSIYVLKGFQYQLVKNVIIMALFVGLLFYLKYKQTIGVVCHLLILISWLNNNINIYLFNDANFVIAFLTVCNIIFAFHTLGSQMGLLYSVLHFIPILTHYILKHLGYHLRSEPPQQIAFAEGGATLVLIFFIIVYLIYHYHKAYELASRAIRQTGDDLQKARELAEEMTRLKSNFLSNMSHEIRTPINGMLGISQVIEFETSDNAIKQYTHLQQQSGHRLLGTISSILELSRLDAEESNVSLEPLEVNALVRDSILPFQSTAEGKQLTFTFYPCKHPLTTYSDFPMLQQVLNNVLSNAVKFTHKGSITVRTFVDKDDPELIVVEVADTGLGISEQFLPRMFNPFEQESTGRSRNYEGTGLGLAIAKRYLDLLQGQIRVATEKGKGSTFQIVLPVHPQNVTC